MPSIKIKIKGSKKYINVSSKDIVKINNNWSLFTLKNSKNLVPLYYFKHNNKNKVAISYSEYKNLMLKNEDKISSVLNSLGLSNLCSQLPNSSICKLIKKIKKAESLLLWIYSFNLRC